LNEVTMRELEGTINEMNKLKRAYPFDKLNEHQKVIYNILEKNRKMQSGLLFNEYRRLVNLGLIKSKGKGRWKIYELPT